MEKQGNRELGLYKVLAFVFIIASAGIATTKISTIPPEYTVIAISLLLGAMGALQCQTLQKRQEQLDALNESLKKFTRTCTNNN